MIFYEDFFLSNRIMVRKKFGSIQSFFFKKLQDLFYLVNLNVCIFFEEKNE